MIQIVSWYIQLQSNFKIRTLNNRIFILFQTIHNGNNTFHKFQQFLRTSNPPPKISQPNRIIVDKFQRNNAYHRSDQSTKPEIIEFHGIRFSPEMFPSPLRIFNQPETRTAFPSLPPSISIRQPNPINFPSPNKHVLSRCTGKRRRRPRKSAAISIHASTSAFCKSYACEIFRGCVTQVIQSLPPPPPLRRAEQEGGDDGGASRFFLRGWKKLKVAEAR